MLYLSLNPELFTLALVTGALWPNASNYLILTSSLTNHTNCYFFKTLFISSMTTSDSGNFSFLGGPFFNPVQTVTSEKHKISVKCGVLPVKALSLEP